jgi:transposase InsO family protein
VRFAFIAKHRGIWPAAWLCGALGVSRGGFHAWLTRPRSARERSNEALAAKARASFLASDRTYGARRVWHDLLAEGERCGLHRVDRLMRRQALRARPRRRRLSRDPADRPVAPLRQGGPRRRAKRRMVRPIRRRVRSCQPKGRSRGLRPASKASLGHRVAHSGLEI